MNARRDHDGPEDIDAAFAEIVADLERDATFARWPEEETAESAPAAEEPRSEGPRE